MNRDVIATAAALDRAIAASPYHRFLGLWAVAGDGRVLIALPGDARHVGDATRRSVHGGVLASFLHATAQLHLRVVTDGRSADVVDFTTTFLRPAAVIDTYAACAVVRLGRRFAHVRVDAWQGDPGRPVAVGDGTFLLG